tara:strand:- start:378 stop:800 length:423 start_codon:yes stop_codon:yes gene_type:complete
MVQQIKKNKYVTRLYLKTEEGREFLKDLLSRKMTDAQLATLYDLTAGQVKRARHKHGLYLRNCQGQRKLLRSNIEETEDIVDAVEVVEVVEPVILRPVRKEVHTVCIELSVDEWEGLKEAADSQCRSIENQAKWILRNAL